MHRQRISIAGEGQARRLLITNGTADQQVRIFAKRSNAVFAVVEDLEIGVRGKDLGAIEVRHATGVSARSLPSRTSEGIALPSVSSICLPHRKQRCSG